MKNANSGSVSSQSRSAQIEALIGRYPNVSADELATLKHWFKKEASSLDVATLASKESIHFGYRRFREDHVDRFGLREWLIIGSVVLVLLVGVIASSILIE